MNSTAIIAGHLSIGPVSQWLTKPHRFRWACFYQWIAVDISVVERYFRLGL